MEGGVFVFAHNGNSASLRTVLELPGVKRKGSTSQRDLSCIDRLGRGTGKFSRGGGTGGVDGDICFDKIWESDLSWFEFRGRLLLPVYYESNHYTCKV